MLHYHHSGRLRPHEHTSYLPLGALLLVVGVALTAYTAFAASPPPQSGSIGLTGTVPGKPPVKAATIASPSPNQRFSATPMTVTGTCPANLLVEIFKNNIFAGSTSCGSDGTYTLQIDLMIGKNVLIARVYDALNQKGPDSAPVTVFYDALPPQGQPITALDLSGNQLLLNTDAVFRGVFPEQTLSVPIDILGGTPPYAVNVQWGDTTNKVIPRNDNLGFTATHAYARPGTYQITLQATDARDRVAFLTVATIVNGQPSVATTTSSSTPSTGIMAQLLALWPLYTGVVATVVSFWLGERREKRILTRYPHTSLPA